MADSEEEIKEDIMDFIRREGGAYSDWYVGISEDLERRLFKEHNVRKENGYITRLAYNSEVARRVEDYFVNTIGTDGETGGGDVDANGVYAYKKRSYTDP